jgi:S1-C subfamily serine protease
MDLSHPPDVRSSQPVEQPSSPNPLPGWERSGRDESSGPTGQPHGSQSTFRTALLAALVSAVLTVTASYAIFRVTAPPIALVGPPASAAAVVAGPGASQSAAGISELGGSLSSLGDANLPTIAGSGASVVTIAARAIPSVVTITATTSQVGGFYDQRSFQQTGVGSGIIVGSNGLILTNAHVVAGADSISVQLASGRQLSGRVYGVSGTTDLAIVKVDSSGLPTAAIGSSRSLNVGEPVVAIGTPLGEYPDSVTTGVVSGLDRSIDVQGTSLTGLIQTDAPINPGNSGGPLLNAGGRVIGVNTATTADAQGVSFAIPIDAARDVIAAALAGQPVR